MITFLFRKLDAIEAAPVRAAHYNFKKADVIVSFGADFLGIGLVSV